ncbi:MAG TPA: bifunctional sugar-1-phosphate nucleotidylyltransferase/acetyltransferase [Candidatus Norongarragalinales archaeon]|nr:bifunctional sugar-1-phosphate nucleotidylyltransferase/acetyltransferase [Candidatus Norongarragalinales archaeon]
MEKTDFVILAAGRGERLWPITNHIPKTMVRILKKPLLEWIVESVYPFARKIVVIVGFKGDAVETHFLKTRFKDKLVFVRQQEQKGTAHALLQAEGEVQGSFVVLNGDNFFDPRSFPSLFSGLKEGDWFLVGKRVEDKSSFGEIVSENGFLREIIEKAGAQEPGVANTNLAFLPAQFFSLLHSLAPSERGELEFTDALAAFAEKNKVRVIEFPGYWNDVGYYWNYLDASEFACANLLEDKREGSIEAGVVVKGVLHLGKGSVIRAPARIEGPVFIGENSIVGPNCFLRKGTVVEDNCHVGSSELKNSILMSTSNAPHFNYVGDSVICEDVNLGAGAITANLRFDDKTVFAEVKGKMVSSGKQKLGCVIGSGTKIGINVSITCGKMVGSDCKIYPRVFVKENVPDGSVVKSDDDV